MSLGSFLAGLGTGLIVTGIVARIVAARVAMKLFGDLLDTQKKNSNRWKP